jgi:hypothetical protein
MPFKTPAPRMTDDEVKSFRRLDSVFRNNGFDPEVGRHVTMKDAMDIQNAAFMIPRVMTQIIQEGIEPLLIGTSLLQKIDYVPGMQTVFPAIEPLRAEEIGDNMGLPIYNINVAGAQTFGTTVKRHGLGLKISKRYIDESTYPWMQMWLRLAGNALARHKEEYIFNFITQLGQVIFNNDPAARTSGYGGIDVPVKGVTTGRNYKGQLNGSMVVDDIFDMYAQLLLNGFIPDTLLVHPMAWLMWVKDPVLREFAIQAGGGSFFANFTGNAAVLGNPFYNFGGLGQGQGQSATYANGVMTGGDPSTPQGGAYQRQTSAPVLPNYLGMPFRILVSPFMKFDPINRTCDMLMFNSKNLGALIVDEEAHVKSFEDSRYGLQEMFIEETYGFGILNEGLAIGVAKNVKITPNEFVLPARTVFNLSESGSTFEDLNTVAEFGGSPLDVNTPR